MEDPAGAPDPDPRVIEATAGEVEVLGLARHFQEYADQVFTRLPLYRRLCEGAAADLFVVDRLRLAEPDQRVPNLLLAAVHDVLLAGEDDPLAAWYSSVVGQGASDTRARPVGRGADDPWPHFQRLALEHEGVAERLRTRATQTNEVGRTLTLLPALFGAAHPASASSSDVLRPLGLVEIGSSAGLNLRMGAYRYRYHHAAGGPAIESAGYGATLGLDCQLRGPQVPPLPSAALPVESAVGLDLRPLRVTDPDDARWLLACQWPEEMERLERLRSAIALAEMDPPEVHRGDAVDHLAQHVLAVAPHALPVVISTWVLNYLPVGRQKAFVEVLDQLGAQRDLAFVFAEQPERVPGLPVPPRPDGGADGRATALVRMQWRAGERSAVRLADQHPHGTWLEWLADSAAGGSLR